MQGGLPTCYSAYTDLAHAEHAAAAVRAVIEGAGSKAYGAGSYGDTAEDTGLVEARAGAVADFVLQRGIENGRVRSYRVGEGAGSAYLVHTGIADYLVSERQVALLGGYVGVGAGIKHEVQHEAATDLCSTAVNRRRAAACCCARLEVQEGVLSERCSPLSGRERCAICSDKVACRTSCNTTPGRSRARRRRNVCSRGRGQISQPARECAGAGNK